MSTNAERAVSAVSSAPPIGVAGMTWFGYPAADWVQVLALVWLVIQIGWFLWSKILRKGKKGD